MNYKIEGEKIAQKVIFQIKLLFIPSYNNDYSPKFLQSKVLFYCVVILFFIRIISVGFFIPFPKNIFFADITKIDLVNILNQNRENIGLKPLVENDKLDQAAMLKAKDMVQKYYFAHQSPRGITPWFWFRQVGYNYKYAGENLAIGFINSSEVFDAWFNSPSHKDNLFNPNYKDVGTAILSGFGNNNTVVVVQIFGSPQIKVVNLVPNKQINNSQNRIQSAEKVTIKNTQNPVEQKVLGQETKINQLTTTTRNLKNNLYLGFINFIVYDYEKLITYISYGLLVVISISLLLNILINFNIQRGQLIFKSILLIIILSAVLFLNKDLIIQIIPHQIII